MRCILSPCTWIEHLGKSTPTARLYRLLYLFDDDGINTGTEDDDSENADSLLPKTTLERNNYLTCIVIFGLF